MDEYISKKEAIIAVTRDGCTANVVGVLYHLPPADVVPKSEVENLKVPLEMTEKAHEGLRELYRTDTDALVEARIKTETEVAREIFEELKQKRNELWNTGKYTMFECWCKAEDELKNKYLEEKE